VWAYQGHPELSPQMVLGMHIMPISVYPPAQSSKHIGPTPKARGRCIHREFNVIIAEMRGEFLNTEISMGTGGGNGERRFDNKHKHDKRGSGEDNKEYKYLHTKTKQ